MTDVSVAKGKSGHSSLIENIDSYKVMISIIFGLLGFALNFYSLSFAFPPYVAVVLIGLLFPMVITLAWGWKYGLLSALVGGCQSMWWLWGPSNGYAIFVVVPPFTLWIVWHGLFADWRRKHQDHRWWSSKYVVEIPFRMLCTINLLTLARWAITLNPPPWDWASGAPNAIPMQFSAFVVIKQAVVGYIILLLTDVLLNLRFVRRFLRLREDDDQTDTGHIISAALLLGCLFWVVDSVLGSLVFHPERSFPDLLALDVPPHEAFARVFFVLACLVGGLLVSNLLRGQRESDKALRESEEKYRLLAENTLDAIWKMDLDLAFTYVNPAVYDLLGFAPEEWIGSRLPEHCSPEDMAKMANIITHELENVVTNTGVAFETSLYNKHGEEIDCEIHGRMVFDEIGQPMGFQGTTRDITERKRVESQRDASQEALAAERNLLRTLIDNTPDFIYVKDRESRFLIGNVALARLMGAATPDGLLRRTDFDFYAEDLATRYHADEQEVMATGQPLIGREEPAVDSEGNMLWVSTTKAPLRDASGDIIGIAGIGRDITERVRAEEKLKEYSERLEEMVDERTRELRDAQEQLVRREKLAVLGQLAGGMGHELRNPLGVISNAVYYLEMVNPDADDTTKEYLDMISAEVHNADRIISDLLDFARIRPADRERIAVSELVARGLEKHPPPEGVQVTTDIAADLPPAYVDPHQIGLVLGNLVTNAYQAMPDGGQLIINAAGRGDPCGRPSSDRPSSDRPSSDRPSSSRPEVSISITDTGCGISTENMKNLFEPLFTTKARGIGLGLAISRNLAQANGGSIEVESTEGEGSTFTVILPTKEREPPHDLSLLK